MKKWVNGFRPQPYLGPTLPNPFPDTKKGQNISDETGGRAQCKDIGGRLGTYHKEEGLKRSSKGRTDQANQGKDESAMGKELLLIAEKAIYINKLYYRCMYINGYYLVLD